MEQINLYGVVIKKEGDGFNVDGVHCDTAKETLGLCIEAILEQWGVDPENDDPVSIKRDIEEATKLVKEGLLKIG